MQHPPGAVCVIHNGSAHWELTEWLVTIFDRGFVPKGSVHENAMGSAPAFQRNLCIRSALQRRPDLQWFLFVDTDQVVPVDAVKRLLDHERPVVGAVICQRYWPFDVTAFWSTSPVKRVQLDELPKEGVKDVAAMGMGCTLIRREVIDALEEPWFAAGRVAPDLMQEDIYFTMQAAKAGFTPAIDCGLRVGHRAMVTVLPGMDGRPWLEVYGREYGARIPAYQQKRKA